LELVLQQDEDLSLDGAYNTPPPQTRDFRADNASPGRFKRNLPGRAYVAVKKPESGMEQEPRVRFEDEVEEPKSAPPELKNPGRESPDGSTSNASAKKVRSEFEIRILIRERHNRIDRSASNSTPKRTKLHRKMKAGGRFQARAA